LQTAHPPILSQLRQGPLITRRAPPQQLQAPTGLGRAQPLSRARRRGAPETPGGSTRRMTHVTSRVVTLVLTRQTRRALRSAAPAAPSWLPSSRRTPPPLSLGGGERGWWRCILVSVIPDRRWFYTPGPHKVLSLSVSFVAGTVQTTGKQSIGSCRRWLSKGPGLSADASGGGCRCGALTSGR
jgi:hypothetical protein